MVCHGKCTQRLTLVTLNYSELMAYVIITMTAIKMLRWRKVQMLKASWPLGEM
jgi:hypothetical protein